MKNTIGCVVVLGMVAGSTLGVAGGRALGDVRLPALMSDGMVLQQGGSARVWGFGRPGEVVTVTATWPAAKDVKWTGTVGKDGRFSVMVDVPKVDGKSCGPFVVTVAGDTSKVISDVLLGEVWVASGQSNMEWPLTATTDGDKFIKSAGDPQMRLFNVNNAVSLHPLMECTGTISVGGPGGGPGGGWAAASPATVPGFSGVAYHFALELRARLGVPVGIIESDWGGTRCEAWTPLDDLASFGAFAGEIAEVKAAADPQQRDGAAGMAAWWKRIDGLKVSGGSGGGAAVGREWMKAEFDAKDWKPMTLPTTFKADGLNTFDGAVYLRRSVELPAGAAGKEGTISLGPIDDRDEVFVNGVSVGKTIVDGAWNSPRTYLVPAGVLKAGSNVVAIRVVDTSGPGGLGGTEEQMKLGGGSGAGAWSVSLAGPWVYRRGASMAEIGSDGAVTAVGPNTLSALYNAMIAPIAPMTVKGAIWYQGESNRGAAVDYGQTFPRMIESWRKAFANPGLAFYFVQIAPFEYGGDNGKTAMLREAQDMTAVTVAGTGMAVTLDCGERRDIHPRQKQVVGQRLAMQAGRKTYGLEDCLADGPRPSGYGFEPGKAVVTFESAGLKGSELELVDVLPSPFEVAGGDNVFYPAAARVVGGTVVVASPAVREPTSVRYGFQNTPKAGLFGKNATDQLPVAPFRSDKLKLGEWKAAAASTLPTPTIPEGFVPLLRAENFGDWNYTDEHKGHWTMSGPGAVTFDGQGPDLWTKKSYKDFEMLVDWRFPLVPKPTARPVILLDGTVKKGGDGKDEMVTVADAGDTGIYLRGSSKSQVNIWCWPIGSGEVYGYRTDPEMNAKVRAGVTPRVNADNPPGEWNRFHIVMKGNKLSVRLNGEVVLREAELPGVAAEGPIALQRHGDAAEFGNIFVKELK